MLAERLRYMGELGRTVDAAKDGAMIAMTKEMAAGLHALIVGLIEDANPSKLPMVFETLRNHMHADPDYAWTWHCNLACASMDEGLEHAAANRAASRFMYACFGVDTSKNEHFDAPQTVGDESPATVALRSLTERMDEHPEGHEGPCWCATCRSYMAEDCAAPTTRAQRD